MTDEVKKQMLIAQIVEILKANEDALSDGYGYYCGSSNVENTLQLIATEIVDLIEMEF